MRTRGIDEPSHWPLHLVLIVMTLLTLYPIFWVVTIAFSPAISEIFSMTYSQWPMLCENFSVI